MGWIIFIIFIALIYCFFASAAGKLITGLGVLALGALLLTTVWDALFLVTVAKICWALIILVAVGAILLALIG